MYAVLYARDTKLKDKFQDLYIVEAKKISDPSAKPSGWFVLEDSEYLEKKSTQEAALKSYLEQKKIDKQPVIDAQKQAKELEKQKAIEDRLNLDKIPSLEQQVALILERLDALEKKNL